MNVPARGSRVPAARLCALWAAAAALALAAGAAVPPTLGRALGAVFLLAAATLAAVDLLLCPRAAEFRFGREVAGTLRAGRPSSVTVAFRWQPRRGSGPRRFWWADGAPRELVARAPEGAGRLPPGETLRAAYEVRPRRRGPVRWGAARAALASPAGFWRLRLAIDAPLERTVYPGPGAAGGLPGRRMDRGVPAPGAEGIEFDGVRPYLPGEDARRMAWRVTARRDQPAVLRLRPERGRRVLLAVDVGRLSSLALGDGEAAPSRLDAFCDAAVRVAAAALSEGDAVGLALLGPAGAVLLPPRGGPAALAPVAEALARAEAAGLDADAGAAVAALLRVPADLILWFGEAPSPEEAGDLLRHLPVLRRTRPLAFLEVAPEPPADAPGERGEVLREAAAAAARDRTAALGALARRGVPAADAPAGRLGASALAAYRALARREAAP